ncbi:MAG: hypothetical protein AAB342_00625, partial [Chloroflexota bacterium]
IPAKTPQRADIDTGAGGKAGGSIGRVIDIIGNKRLALFFAANYANCAKKRIPISVIREIRG